MSWVMGLSDPLAVLASWLATYALHSTILLALAMLVAPRLGSDAWRESLWRVALLGALLTTTVQATVGYTPVVGRWTMGGGTAERSAIVINESPARWLEPDGTVSPARPTQGELASQTESAQVGEEMAAPDDAPPPLPAQHTSERRAPVPLGLALILVATWILVAVLLLGRLGFRQLRLFRLLGDRRPIYRGPLAEMLAGLRRNAGVWTPVRLSASPVCPTPVALGWSEICVPERFLADLAPDQQQSALAHELAHLKRRDPAWELVAGVIEALFFFQPLNRFARFRLRDAAENLCDDWAVRQTGSPLSLARCLTDIASWVGAGPEPLPTTGTTAMAEGGSPLLRRVQRLAEHGIDPPPPRIRLVGAFALLALTATVAPAISLSSPGTDTEEASMGQTAIAITETSRQSLGGTTQQDAVIVHPNPSSRLAERWEWALERDLPNGFWIAWGTEGGIQRDVDVLNGDHEVIVENGTISSNSPGPGRHTPYAPSLEELLAGAADELPKVVFVFGFGVESDRSGDVDWVRLRSSTAPLDLIGRPLVWLGTAGTQQSLAQLRSIYAALENPALKKEIAAAFSLHEGQDQVVQTVREVVEEEENAEVRSEAVQWLSRGQEGGQEIVALLTETALTDSSPDVRNDAVDALGSIGSPVAMAALFRLARTAPRSETQLQAVEQFDSTEMLLQIIRTAPDHGVRLEAVEALDDFAALLQIARTAPNPEVRAEAIETLDNQPSDDLAAELLSMTFDDPATVVQIEAVDQLASLGHRGFGEARRALERIVETHPDWEVRSEAAQALAALARQNR